MHQMGAAADLDVAFAGRLREGVEQPMGVVIQHQPVPCAANDRNRRTDLSRVIGKLAVPGLDDLAERAERRFDTSRVARAAFWITIEIALFPFVEIRKCCSRPSSSGAVENSVMRRPD